MIIETFDNIDIQNISDIVVDNQDTTVSSSSFSPRHAYYAGAKDTYAIHNNKYLFTDTTSSNNYLYEVSVTTNKPIFNKLAEHCIAVKVRQNGDLVYATINDNEITIVSSTGDTCSVTIESTTLYNSSLGRFIEVEYNDTVQLLLILNNVLLTINNTYTSINYKLIQSDYDSIITRANYLIETYTSGYNGYIKTLDISQPFSAWQWEDTNVAYGYQRLYKMKNGTIITYSSYTGYGTFGTGYMLNNSTDFAVSLRPNPYYGEDPEEEEYEEFRQECKNSGGIIDFIKNGVDTVLLVTTDHKLYKSVDNGQYFTDITEDIKTAAGVASGSNIGHVFEINGTVFCILVDSNATNAANNKILYSTDGCTTWQISTVPVAITNYDWTECFYNSRYNIYILNSSNSSIYSADNCATWNVLASSTAEEGMIGLLQDYNTHTIIVRPTHYRVTLIRIVVPVVYSSLPVTGAQAKEYVRQFKAYVQSLKT